jgi:hypothetical protein
MAPGAARRASRPGRRLPPLDDRPPPPRRLRPPPPVFRFHHVVGVDDFPFERASRGDVPVVGAVFAGPRLDGIVSTRVRRDGANATRRLAEMIGGSKFAPQLRLVLLQGIALAGFNVVDVATLAAELGLPVLVVARREPRLGLIRDALLARIPGGARKWRLIERLGPMEPLAGVWVQRVGLSVGDAAAVLARYTLHGSIPEPLRVAHLIAGGMGAGESRGRT